MRVYASAERVFTCLCGSKPAGLRDALMALPRASPERHVHFAEALREALLLLFAARDVLSVLGVRSGVRDDGPLEVAVRHHLRGCLHAVHVGNRVLHRLRFDRTVELAELPGDGPLLLLLPCREPAVLPELSRGAEVVRVLVLFLLHLLDPSRDPPLLPRRVRRPPGS